MCWNEYSGKHVWSLCLTHFTTLLTNRRLVSRFFDSNSQKEGPCLGGNSLRVSEALSVNLQAIPTSAVHFCQAGIKWDAIIKTTEPVGSNAAGSGEKMPVPLLLRGFFLSLSWSPCEADRVEAVEQQGRRKGDSDCLFHIRGQFCSVP